MYVKDLLVQFCKHSSIVYTVSDTAGVYLYITAVHVLIFDVFNCTFNIKYSSQVRMLRLNYMYMKCMALTIWSAVKLIAVRPRTKRGSNELQFTPRRTTYHSK